MHRHGYKGRKLGRERDQRRALIKTLASQLIDHHSIRTTLPKAKDLRPYVEKLVTKARKGDLASRRLVIAKVSTKESAHHLFDRIWVPRNGATCHQTRYESHGRCQRRHQRNHQRYLHRKKFQTGR